MTQTSNLYFFSFKLVLEHVRVYSQEFIHDIPDIQFYRLSSCATNFINILPCGKWCKICLKFL